jgi:histidine triad (HIT) family protein
MVKNQKSMIKQQHAQDCIFCKIIAKEIPCKIRYEDDNWLAFDDIHPSAPTHILLIPKTHFDTLETIDQNQVYAQMLPKITEIAQELGLKSYRLGLNVNPPNQEVMHVHLHLLSEEKI